LATKRRNKFFCHFDDLSIVFGNGSVQGNKSRILSRLNIRRASKNKHKIWMPIEMIS